jgi:hypothetical protein
MAVINDPSWKSGASAARSDVEPPVRGTKTIADRGANTEHDGRTYIFFNDIRRSPGPAWPPDDSDLVAFIEDVPFPAGGHLATARHSDHRSTCPSSATTALLYVSWVIDGGRLDDAIARLPQSPVHVWIAAVTSGMLSSSVGR